MKSSIIALMHELSLCQAIVENVGRMALKDGAKKVKSVTVRVGAISGVEKGPLEFCFPQAAKGTLLEESQLLVEETPLKVNCAECGKDSEPAAFTMQCLHCQSSDVEVVSGKEFKLVSMEIE